MSIYVIYKGKMWKLKNSPVSQTLLLDLRKSNPNFQCQLENASNSRLKKEVSISEVRFQFEN